MNFDEAIQAHANWKVKLAAYLRKPDQSVNCTTLAMDNVCALGKWIHGGAPELASDPDFQQLKKVHARFHQAAAAIVRKANAGQQVTEEVALGAKSEYNKCSEQVIQLIMKMKWAVKV